MKLNPNINERHLRRKHHWEVPTETFQFTDGRPLHVTESAFNYKRALAMVKKFLNDNHCSKEDKVFMLKQIKRRLMNGKERKR